MTDEDILSVAKEEFKHIQEAEYDIRKASLEDIKFTYNIEEGQWNEQVLEERVEDRRPALTSNKLRKFVAQIANQERQTRPAGKIIPVDDNADPALARVYQDIIRNIEYQSSADEIYVDVGEHALAGGFGYWRILADWEEDGFYQELKIEKIDNPFSVYLDPKGKYCFIRDKMSRKDFEAEYPKAVVQDFESGATDQLWYEEDSIFIAEYFHKEPVIRNLAQIRDPSGEINTIEVKDERTLLQFAQEGIEILKTRKAKSHKIMWYKITAHDILEREEWVGKDIPVVEVLGDYVNVAGKIYKRSLIRDAKDPQRMYNYHLTAATERAALSPKAPYFTTPQQILGHEKMWNEMHFRNRPYVLYNLQGNAYPRREQPVQIDPGSMALLNIANNDIRDTLGMYETAVGEQGNERSGRAIAARNQRSDTGTFKFPDNLRRAILKTQKLLIDLIPKIYDTERIIRIRGANGDETSIPINKTVIDEMGNPVIINNLSVGKYDVRPDVGSTSTRRQETIDTIRDAMQYAPQAANMIVDLLFKYSDAPGAQEIEERLRPLVQQMQAMTMGGQIPAETGSKNITSREGK